MRTPFMIARSGFHGGHTAELAKEYVDAALAASLARNIREAIASELDHAGFGAEATRVRA